MGQGALKGDLENKQRFFKDTLDGAGWEGMMYTDELFWVVCELSDPSYPVKGRT